MLNTLKLLLPALVPSWRFFDGIAPSPRVQYVLLDSNNEPIHRWLEFRARPDTLSFTCMLKRMLWNPQWNESLFLVSCSERLIENPTKHSENEILQRIINELKEKDDEIFKRSSSLQFRLKFVHRDNHKLVEKIVYQSKIKSLENHLVD